jgi:hypothetical protein
VIGELLKKASWGQRPISYFFLLTLLRAAACRPHRRFFVSGAAAAPVAAYQAS